MNTDEYQLVRSLFHELADLPAEDWPSALDRPEVSAEVREEVLALLGDSNDEGFFQQANMLEVVDEITAASDPGLDGQPITIGTYQVLQRLGEGGMGVVYSARREDSTTLSAVKLLRIDVVSHEGLAQRFLRETRVLQELRHPGIAAFQDAGEATVTFGSGATARLPYLAMEFIEGDSLLEGIRRRQLSIHQRMEIVARICDALHHAHGQGIIHRDLKPDNILIPHGKAEDPLPTPKVLDFGVAHAQQFDMNSVAQTRTGAVIGTLWYMSPEQVAGKSEIDARSDVYSLGVLLFELLTGQLPYPVQGCSVLEAAQVIQRDEATRLTSLTPTLPREVDHIVGQALEKEPGRRYPTAQALGDDLRAAIAGHPVMARGPGVVRRFRKWAVRHPAATGAMSATAVALVVLVWLLIQAIEARKDADTNAVAAQQREKEAKAATTLAEERGRQLEGERQSLLGLSDLKRVRDLEAEAETLWPVRPDLVSPLTAWLDRAREVLDNRPAHEALAEDLSGNRGTMASLLNSTERAWWLETLQILTQEMGSLYQTVQSISQRLDSAKTIEQRTLIDCQEPWDHAITYAADPDGPYAGLELFPLLGLVPLLEDPDSELLEFWHVESGEEPGRDPDTGQFLMTPESGIVLVLIPTQTFVMGTQREDPLAPGYDPWHVTANGPPHRVTVSPFLISKYEMSRGQWRRIMNASPSLYGRYSAQTPEAGRAYPVETVTRRQVARALHRYGLSFPTEAQWESAARAGEETTWWFGDELVDFGTLGNVGDWSAQEASVNLTWSIEEWRDGYHGPAPLGAFPPNWFGIHEITGNLREMCLDEYSMTFFASSPEVDPVCLDSGEEFGFLSKDGDFASAASDSRPASRKSVAWDFLSSFNGVRPARSLDP